MTDYENLRDLLGGDALATRAARALTSSGVAYTVGSLLNVYAQDPDFLVLRGIGAAAQDRIHEACAPYSHPNA